MAWSLDLTDSQVQAVNLKILFASSQYGRGHINHSAQICWTFAHLQLIKLYCCTNCKISFSGAVNLEAHLLTHTGEKPWRITLVPSKLLRGTRGTCAIHSVQLSHTGAQFANMDQRNCCALMPILFARLLVIYWCVSSFFNQPWTGRVDIFLTFPTSTRFV